MLLKETILTTKDVKCVDENGCDVTSYGTHTGM
jgi:hypothetical protein